MLAVTQNDVSDISDTESVDHDGSSVDFASYCCAVLIEFHDITGIHEEDVLFRDAEALCYFCVCFQMTVFAVYRDRVFRFYQGVDQFDFLLACMSGYVNVLEYDVGTLCRQFVDDV